MTNTRLRRSSAVQRLREDPRFQQAFRQLHLCGPQPIGVCFADLLDHVGADPAALDFVLNWCILDPEFVAALAGEFPGPLLDLVRAA